MLYLQIRSPHNFTLMPYDANRMKAFVCQPRALRASRSTGKCRHSAIMILMSPVVEVAGLRRNRTRNARLVLSMTLLKLISLPLHRECCIVLEL